MAVQSDNCQCPFAWIKTFNNSKLNTTNPLQRHYWPIIYACPNVPATSEISARKAAERLCHIQ